MHDSETSRSDLPADLGIIEGDQFCSCGYNLHGQKVEADERLGFPIVRCAECGRFHPAGSGSSATRPWLRRLATLLLVIWIGFALLWSVAVGATWFGLGVGIAEEYGARVTIFEGTGQIIKQVDYEEQAKRQTEWQQLYQQAAQSTGAIPFPQPLEPLEERWVDAETGESIDFGGQNQWRLTERAVMDHNRANALGLVNRDDRPPVIFAALLIGIAMLLGLISGVLQSIGMPHLKVPAVFLPSLAAVAIVAITFSMFYAGDADYFRFTGHWITSLAYTTLPAVGTWWLAMTFGRPVARVVVSIMIPPRPRQVFAYLWHADGKQMPTGKAVA